MKLARISDESITNIEKKRSASIMPQFESRIITSEDHDS